MRGLRYSDVVSTLALFIALGGASYAALELPRDSVGERELKNGAVARAKLRREAVTSSRIGRGAVRSRNLQDRSVSAEKLGAHVVGLDKLGFGVGARSTTNTVTPQYCPGNSCPGRNTVLATLDVTLSSPSDVILMSTSRFLPRADEEYEVSIDIAQVPAATAGEPPLGRAIERTPRGDQTYVDVTGSATQLSAGVHRFEVVADTASGANYDPVETRLIALVLPELPG